MKSRKTTDATLVSNALLGIVDGKYNADVLAALAGYALNRERIMKTLRKVSDCLIQYGGSVYPEWTQEYRGNLVDCLHAIGGTVDLVRPYKWDLAEPPFAGGVARELTTYWRPFIAGGALLRKFLEPLNEALEIAVFHSYKLEGEWLHAGDVSELLEVREIITSLPCILAEVEDEKAAASAASDTTH